MHTLPQGGRGQTPPSAALCSGPLLLSSLTGFPAFPADGGGFLQKLLDQSPRLVREQGEPSNYKCAELAGPSGMGQPHVGGGSTGMN